MRVATILLAHQKSTFDEWSANLTLKFDPGADKRGLRLALAPVWGAESSRIEQMWDSAKMLHAGADQGNTAGLPLERLEFEWGHGLVSHEETGAVTPYGGMSLGTPGVRGYRLGGRVEVGESMNLNVKGERKERARGAAEHRLTLRGHVYW